MLKRVCSISSLALGLLSFSGTVGAQSLDHCVTLDSDLDRLACYDGVAGRTPQVDQSEDPDSEWNVRTETSALTDEENVILSVRSEEVIDCGWNRGDRIRLYVRCIENTTAFIFTTNCHMTSHGGYGTVDYRIDDAPARQIRMQESTNNRSLGLWYGGQSIPLIRSLFGARQLIARMTPFSENSFTVTFNVAGLEEAIAPLREACHW